LNEEFLGQVGVGGARAFFNEQTGAARRSNERMMRNYAVQLGPETIDVRRLQAFYPLRILYPVVAALSRERATFAWLEVHCLFRIFAYGFHGLSFALLVWEFVF
jgi:hypothetical protein